MSTKRKGRPRVKAAKNGRAATTADNNFQKEAPETTTQGSYWSSNVWMESMAIDLFYDAENSPKQIIDQNLHVNNVPKVTITLNNDIDPMELDIQSCVEIPYDETCETKDIDVVYLEEKIVETVPLLHDSYDTLSEVNFAISQDSFDHNYFLPQDSFDHNDLLAQDGFDHNYCRQQEVHIPKVDDLNYQSLVELSCDGQEFSIEESDLTRDVSFTNEIVTDEVSCTFTSDLTNDSGFASQSDNISLMTENEDNKEVEFLTKSNLKKKDQSFINGEKVKNKIVARKRAKHSREVLVSKESPVIEGDFEEMRRVTRHLAKSSVEKNVKNVENIPGKLVWGRYRGLWWPAIIIKAEDAGMFSTDGKIWVIWIGEEQISELKTKNIESFSSNLEIRLESLETNLKTKGNNKRLKDETCFKTIKLLKKYFSGGAMIRPYTMWIKINIIPYKEKLDEILFYPYPETIAEKLKELKKTNFGKTEKYLKNKIEDELTKENQAKNPIKKTEKPVEKPEKPLEEGGINIMDQKPGMIVWAKMPGYSLWPCVIMNYQHLNRKQPNVAHQWVMWYGDYKYSQVQYRQIYTFPTGIEKMEAKIRGKNDDLFCNGVLQASKDYCEPLGFFTHSWNLDYVVDLFIKSKHRFELKNAELKEPNEEDLYSQKIKKQLRKQINNQPVNRERKKKILNSQILQQALKGEQSIDKFCISCFEIDDLKEHPFFHVSLCNKCLDEFRTKIFAYGNDGKCFYCTLCGSDDSVAMCDSLSCPRVFCTACIECIISPEFYEDILQRQPWYCFICESYSFIMKKSVIKIRENWKKMIISLYRSDCNDELRTNFERFDFKKKIRVLSLFDGIGTGLLVLKNLKIPVEKYFASEIDPDSMQITFFNHGYDVIQLGDVRKIDENKIKEIVPIDLLIGGSPCNELSMANPKRRGLDDPEGTGILFYDYCRIKRLIMKHNKKRHLFWLFENVASMPKKFRNQISENLGREPMFLDSAEFSAQHRPRLYWGNLPWGPYQVNDVILQDVLKKQCNRQALVKKIMTVTTRTNSLSQTKANLKPVLMDGKKDSLWVTELEEIFGFPQHYTDANLQKTRRLQLLGKAWSVQTLMAILRPIFFF